MVGKEDIPEKAMEAGTCTNMRKPRNFQETAIRTGLLEHMAHNGEWWDRCLDKGIRLRIWKASVAQLRSLSSLVGHGMP